jgi:hypothetical protein
VLKPSSKHGRLELLVWLSQMLGAEDISVGKRACAGKRETSSEERKR